MVARSRSDTWHFITPTAGGVRDYAESLAAALAADGDEVHVWSPSGSDQVQRPSNRVVEHPVLGRFGAADLRRTGRALSREDAPRRIFVHWVPHGFGWRSMNFAFCLWLLGRRLRGDRVELLVHEPFLSFGEGSTRQDLVAAIHRPMTALLLAAACRVWISIPAWRDLLRPLAFGRPLGFDWLPMPSNVPVIADTQAVERARGELTEAGGLIVGHFGTYAEPIVKMLAEVIPPLLERHSSAVALLLGRGGEAFAKRLIVNHPEHAGRIAAPGLLDERELSISLSACDVMVQPYPDGVSTRRTSVMAGLAHGRAVVTTTGHLSEPLWAEKDLVAHSPVGDRAGFVAEAERLLLDDERRRTLGRRAAAVYAAEFDISISVRRLREMATAGQ